MSAINRYISISPDDIREGNVVEGASSTATAYIELRMLTQTAGNAATNLTWEQVVRAMYVFRDYLQRGGINEFVNGTNGGGTELLPLPGPAP